MFPRVSMAVFIFALMAALTVQSAVPQRTLAGVASAQQVIKADQMSKREFTKRLKTLPADAIIEMKGKRTTAGEMRASMQMRPEVVEARKQKLTAKSSAEASQAQAYFMAIREKFEQQHRAEVQARNTRVMAELTNLHEVAAIEQEGSQLFSRYQSASATEKAQIDRRAAELFERLRKLRQR